MNKYFVMVTVNKKDYMSSTIATSLASAEHHFLDMGVCGRHAYGVEGALAFDSDGIKTDTFSGCMLSSEMVSEPELIRVIQARNAEIMERDAAEDELSEINKKIAALMERKNQLEKILK